ncbi:GNAT family N-acetyltransferase [Labrenzia sp. CE80]|uniref:GNAT family N-acetyltransferase n=1 Tax=Labrenzia sp. CE80 TaxID=1788986 RepID=UPI00129A685A|nr:GNAT family N-acetyltransferase [Labrenzia sp. CE80]
MKIKLQIVCEVDFDFDQTSEVACQAFGKETPELSARRFEWTYRSGYKQVLVVSAFSEGKKIGQAGAILKKIYIGEKEHKAAELIDLFVLPDVKDFRVVSEIYRKLKSEIKSRNIFLIYTHPNKKSLILNKRFFKLNQITVLPIKVGFRRIFIREKSNKKFKIYRGVECISKEIIKINKSFICIFDQMDMRKRIDSPVHSYFLVSDGNLGFLCSPRTIRGVKILLVCATYCQSPEIVSKAEICDALAISCKVAKRFAYVYVGWNRVLGNGFGFHLPRRWSSNKFSIQSNFVGEHLQDIEKFEIIDLDYG